MSFFVKSIAYDERRPRGYGVAYYFGPDNRAQLMLAPFHLVVRAYSSLYYRFFMPKWTWWENQAHAIAESFMQQKQTELDDWKKHSEWLKTTLTLAEERLVELNRQLEDANDQANELMDRADAIAYENLKLKERLEAFQYTGYNPNG